MNRPAPRIDGRAPLLAVIVDNHVVGDSRVQKCAIAAAEAGYRVVLVGRAAQTPDTFTILGTAPAAHFTRTTAARPPKPNEPAEDEFIAARLFGTRDPAAAERIAHGHAVLGSYTSAGGGTVVTSGCTDWAHGLAGRDPQVERITANVLDQLG